MAVQRFEDSLQCQYDGHFQSYVHALQNKCRDHVGQEEDKLRKELQLALTQESSVCRDQLQQTCQEEYADQVSTQERTQLLLVVAEQEDAMMRLQADSQHALSRQHEEHAQKQHALFHEFDSAIRDKGQTVHALQRELVNHKEHTLLELEQAHMDAERVANVSRLVPMRLQLRKRQHMQWQLWLVQLQFRLTWESSGPSLGAFAGNVNLRARSKGSSATSCFDDA